MKWSKIFDKYALMLALKHEIPTNPENLVEDVTSGLSHLVSKAELATIIKNAQPLVVPNHIENYSQKTA
jgi:hypothetical protein